MNPFVSLNRLPEDFVIPNEYADRLTFDAALGRLTFHGHMSKSDFDRLSSRTRDWEFRRKLEELFRRCVYNGRSKPESSGGLLASLRRRFVPG